MVTAVINGQTINIDYTVDHDDNGNYISHEIDSIIHDGFDIQETLEYFGRTEIFDTIEILIKQKEDS